MEDYESLLEEAYKEIKPLVVKECFERWEILKANVQYNGNKTVICNFNQICSCLSRSCEHLAKFLSKELASFSKIEKDKLILNNRVSPEKINEKIKVYVNKYVICAECKKPDTELIKKDGLIFMHCLACGARHSLGRV